MLMYWLFVYLQKIGKIHIIMSFKNIKILKYAYIIHLKAKSISNIIHESLISSCCDINEIEYWKNNFMNITLMKNLILMIT